MQRTKAVLSLIIFLTGFAVGFDIRDPVPSILTPESPLYASKLVEEEREVNSAGTPLKRLAVYDRLIIFRINEIDAVLKKGKPAYLNCLCMSYYRTLSRNNADLQEIYAVGKLPKERALEIRKNLINGRKRLAAIENNSIGEARALLKCAIERTDKAIASIDSMMKGIEIEKMKIKYTLS